MRKLVQSMEVDIQEASSKSTRGGLKFWQRQKSNDKATRLTPADYDRIRNAKKARKSGC